MDPLFIGGLAFTALISASIAALHAARVVVPRVAAWPMAPASVITKELAPYAEEIKTAIGEVAALGYPFGEIEVSPAIEDRRVLGHIVFGTRRLTREGEGVIGSATVQAEFFEDDDGAGDPISDESGPKIPDFRSDPRDILHTDDKGVIKSAYIYVDPGILPLLNREMRIRLFKHELVHAHGGLHVQTALLGLHKRGKHEGEPRLGIIARKRGHLMHPKFSEGGDDVEGVAVNDLAEAAKSAPRE